MRISDWSSDVCSSDLVPAPNAIASVAISLPSDGRSLRHELHLATFYLFGKHFAHQLQREEVRDGPAEHPALHPDRTSVVKGKSVSERVAHGGRRTRKKQTEDR